MKCWPSLAGFFANPVLLRQGWCHNVAKTLGSIGGSVFVVLMILSWQGGVSRWAFFDGNGTPTRVKLADLLGLGRALLAEYRLGPFFCARRLYHWNCDANSKRLVDFDSAVAVARWTSVVFSIPSYPPDAWGIFLRSVNPPTSCPWF